MSSEEWYDEYRRLADSPSRRHGISEEKEQSYLQQTANFIQEMGRKLSLPLLCINTAVLFTQRFYTYHPLNIYERFSIGASALFLAAKVEEHPRKLEHICHAAKLLGPGKDMKDADYVNELLQNENFLLMTLGFQLQVQHPHQHVIRLCGILKASREFQQNAYILATYCLHLTKMCLVYKPNRVACLCVFMVSKRSGWVPTSPDNKKWFHHGDPTATEEMLERLHNEFLIVYNKCPEKCKNKTLKVNHENLSKKVIVDQSGFPVVRTDSNSEATATPLTDGETEGKTTQTGSFNRSIFSPSCNESTASSASSFRSSTNAVNTSIQASDTRENPFLPQKGIHAGATMNNKLPASRLPVMKPEKVTPSPNKKSELKFPKDSTRISPAKKHHGRDRIPHMKPTSSRNSLNFDKDFPRSQSALSQPQPKTENSCFDLNKNKWVSDLNQSKPSHAPSLALQVNKHSSQPVHPERSSNRSLPVSSSHSVPTSQSHQKPNNSGQPKLPIPSHGLTPENLAQLLNQPLQRPKPVSSLHPGSLKISIPRNRISGFQPLVPPQPATPADVKTDQMDPIPKTASMGTTRFENSDLQPKRFKPN